MSPFSAHSRRTRRHGLQALNSWVAVAIMLTVAALQVVLLTRLATQPGYSTHATSPSLALVVPFTAQRPELVVQALSLWLEAGSPCSRAERGRVDLYFLNNRGEDEIEQTSFLQNLSRLPFLQQHAHCFGRVGLLHARLSGLRDAYPAGPSFMFFDIFTAAHLQNFRASYSYMFWMEWDVTPIKPYWLDRLAASCQQGSQFWIKGSMLQGTHLDAAALAQQNWDWLPHINGNALYALNDERFVEFIKIVVDYEPPIHYWKPFDISMWRVMHAFPYTWPLYQRYGHFFQYTDVIKHYSFALTPDLKNAAEHGSNTYLVHGATNSAGKVQFEAKFKDIERLRSVEWIDALRAEHNVSVMLCSHAADAHFAELAVQSIIKFMPACLEIVVVVPIEDRLMFQHFKKYPKVVLIPEQRLFDSGQLQQKYFKIMADTYCRGQFIFHLNSDMVLYRTVLNRDIFWRGKPMLEYDRYANLPRNAAISWQAGTSNAIGQPVLHEFSRRTEHVYPREVYSRARHHLEARFQQPVTNFLQTRIASWSDAFEHNLTVGGNVAQQVMFSDFNFLGAYMWHHMQNAVSWLPLDPYEREISPFPAPILPDIACQGDAALAADANMTIEHQNAMAAAMERGECSSLAAVIDEAMKIVGKWM